MRTALLSLLAAAAFGSEAMHFAVDQPGSWYDPAVSHHARHGLGGGAIGALAYVGTVRLTPERDRRIAAATAIGLAVGAAYEVARGRDGSAYVDPIDALWVGAGAFAGAALADLTGQALSVAMRPESGGTTIVASVVWRF